MSSGKNAAKKSYQIEFSYFEQFINYEKTPGNAETFKLNNMRRLLSDFGNPHDGLELVHVAGSKGKGSTAAYLAHLLARTKNESIGIYGSPHVHNYRERFRCAKPGKSDYRTGFFSDACYAHCLSEIRDFNDSNPGYGSTSFELMTLFAFLCFRHEKITCAVIEVGLGGRLDSTNVISPLLCIITPIELEHQLYLGNSLGEIAFEKAGIIKPGVPVISATQKSEVSTVISKRALELESPLLWLDSLVKNSPELRTSQSQLKNPAAYLRHNMLLALTAARFLSVHIFRQPHKLDSQPVRKELESIILPGRFEKRFLKRDGQLIPLYLDGAHTAESMKSFFIGLKEDGAKKIYCIFSALADKDIGSMLKIILVNSQSLIISSTGNFKRSDIRELEKQARLHQDNQSNCSIQVEAKVQNALNSACEAIQLKKAETIAVCGSFYLLGEIYSCLDIQNES